MAAFVAGGGGQMGEKGRKGKPVPGPPLGEWKSWEMLREVQTPPPTQSGAL